MSVNDREIGGAKKSNKKHVVIGKIYADWCGHCQTLKPEWEKMKRFVRMNMGRMFKNVHIEFSEIGDTEENKMQNKTVDGMISAFNAKHKTDLKVDGGFPTLFRVCNGKVEYYSGPRTAVDMWKWYKTACESHNTSKTQHASKPAWRMGGGGSRRNRTNKKRSNQRRSKKNRSVFSFF